MPHRIVMVTLLFLLNLVRGLRIGYTSGANPPVSEETRASLGGPRRGEQRREGRRNREGATVSGPERGAFRTEGACVPASSYLSRSWLSCSDTIAFSRRRSHGPFLRNPLLQTPGDPRSPAGGALSSPQRAMSPSSAAPPRRPFPASRRGRFQTERSAPARNPPPKGKG